MKNKGRLRLAVAIISVSTAISILLYSQYRRRRRQKCPRDSCYLQAHPKPQCSFKRVLADNSFSPFKHLNSSKDVGADCGANLHPFEEEITKLLESPVLELGLADEVRDSETSESFVWVETESQLKELADALSKESVIAVDTEQHSLRSFLGFTALIQVSTRKDDYLVDAIALHDFMGHLRPVFADPSICKVFHGADNDVLWLQRDFHIYVVNLFDTAKACEVLTKPQRSLAYLLETYCGVTTNKLLQREDWRQRPLSTEMVKYARTDAHYLLFIAERLISEMEELENDINASENSSPDDKIHFVVEASRRSNMITLQLYAKETEASPGESAASSILSRHMNGLSSTSNEFQDRVRRLCAWRDLMARVHDESCRYVLSDQAIIALAGKAPMAMKDVRGVVYEADSNTESNSSYVVQSPSSVVLSHWDDFDKVENTNDVFPMILQKCLGSKGSCPLSVFNYALLLNWDSKLSRSSKQSAMKNPKQFKKKVSRDLFVQKFSCKSPVYHNCRIYANDGRLLCYCDHKKLEWYISRNLAKLVEENPPAIMLLFEPKGRPEDEDNDFYIQSKRNICVGCGHGNHYLRYRIIPSCYRMHFPEHLKSHRSHDIVLLCVDCHEVAHVAAEKHKRNVAQEFGVPLFVRSVVDAEEAAKNGYAGVSPLQLRTAAMALLRHGSRMPPNRREELTEVVARYYGRSDISEEDLERAFLVGMNPQERKRFEKKKGLSLKYLRGKEDFNLVATMEQNTDNEESSPAGGADANEECDKNTDGFSNGDVKYCYDGHEGITPPIHKSKLSLLGHGPHGKQVVDYLLREHGDEGLRQFCQCWRQVFVEALSPRFLPAGWDIMHRGKRDFGDFSVYNTSINEAS